MISKNTKIYTLPHQKELLLNTKPDAMIAVVGGLGTGKTYSLILKSILSIIANPGYDGMLIEPTYRLCLDTLVPTWDTVCKQYFPWLKYKFLRGDMVIRLPQFRAKVLLRSADDPVRLRGPNLAWVGIDEPGQIALEAFEDAAGRARVSNYRQVFLTGTPEGINWFADKFDVPEAPYEVIRAKVRHPSLAKTYEQRLHDIYQGQPEKVRSYLNGEFVQLHEGLCYSTFNRDDHTGANISIDERYPVYLACDFNVDPLAWLVCQEHDDGSLVVVDEIGVVGTTEDAAQEFIRRFPRQPMKQAVINIYGDRSGKSGSTRSNETDYNIIIRVLRQAGWNVTNFTPDCNPPIVDRVNAVNNFISHGRLQVNSNCKETIQSFMKTTWKPGTRQIKKPAGERHTHWTDALGYLIHKKYNMLTTRTVVHTGLDNRYSPDFSRKVADFSWSR